MMKKPAEVLGKPSSKLLLDPKQFCEHKMYGSRIFLGTSLREKKEGDRHKQTVFQRIWGLEEFCI
jgi:hypothetical protein